MVVLKPFVKGSNNGYNFTGGMRRRYVTRNKFSNYILALIALNGVYIFSNMDGTAMIRYLFVDETVLDIPPPKEAKFERSYDNLIFTSEKCKELGMENDFEVCAVLEFCSYSADEDEMSEEDPTLAKEENGEKITDEKSPSSHDQQRDATSVTRKLQENNRSDENDEEDADSEETSYMAKVDNQAIYGYRIEGSKECLWPGPIMRLQQGGKHGLFLRGGEEATNLHLHGLHNVAEWKRSDWMYRSVQGDENLLVYEIDLSNHMGGTHWYHSHLQASAWEQVKGGAFGMIVIDDNEDYSVDSSDANVLEFLNNREKILILDNSHGGDQKHSENHFVANGQIEDQASQGSNIEVLNIEKDEWYRLRILLVNVDSHQSSFLLSFDKNGEEKCQVHALAHDGMLRFEVPRKEPSWSYYLTTGSRLDVAIKCSGTSDIWIDEQTIARIRVKDEGTVADGKNTTNANEEEETRDSSKEVIATPFAGGKDVWYSRRMDYLADLRLLPSLEGRPPQKHDLRVDETNINHMNEARKKPMCYNETHDFSLNTIQEWDLHGVMVHPLHLHLYPMQVVSEGCSPHHEVGEFYDTILAPESSISDKCLVRINLETYKKEDIQPVTVQCATWEHRQHGAITFFNTVNNDNDGKKIINATDSTQQNDGTETFVTCIGTCNEDLELPSRCQ